MSNSTKISLGPLLFFWDNKKWQDFYYQIADEAEIDNVFIGEAVCSKRITPRNKIFKDVLERLNNAGKKVYVSSLALVMGEDADMMHELASLADEYTIEANDISMIGMLEGKEFAVGTYVNTYNEGTAKYFEKSGATRICVPVEMPFSAVKEIKQAVDIPIEVNVFGKMPLAISPRCYHARLGGRDKVNCGYLCSNDHDGKDIETLHRQPILSVNGLQTLSYTYLNLINEIPVLKEAGFNDFRLSPHSCDMTKIAKIFKEVADNHMEVPAAIEAISGILPHKEFSNGYFFGKEGYYSQSVVE